MLALSFLSNSLSRSRMVDMRVRDMDSIHSAEVEWWICVCETWVQFTQQKSNGGHACARHGFNSLSRSRMVDMRVRDMDSIHSAEVEWLTCMCEAWIQFNQQKSNGGHARARHVDAANSRNGNRIVVQQDAT